MKREEIKEKKRIGDLTAAAEIMGLKRGHAIVIWQRPNSKHYPKLEATLSKLIKARELLLASSKNSASL